ncbi:hypothetical protein NC651_021548 [Populus alba x Populus x berolinensis]|nr:hypothetical protein NC651_021548 [Populus alba x Populus x berolinensis]
MTEAGLKPRQILKRLRQSNPELLSTPKHVYNVKAKLRQGNMTGRDEPNLCISSLLRAPFFGVRNFKSLRPEKSAVRDKHLSIAEPSWRQRYPMRVPNFIGGRLVNSQSFASIDVINPATQQVVSQVPLTTNEEFRAAVFCSKASFSTVERHTYYHPSTHHVQVPRAYSERYSMSITTEHGKTLKDAHGDRWWNMLVDWHLCRLGSLFPTYRSGNLIPYSIREPLGGLCWDMPFRVSSYDPTMG